jgi:hypothetical protein
MMRSLSVASIAATVLSACTTPPNLRDPQSGGPRYSYSAGALFACGIRDTGAVRCLGQNRLGQLGDGTKTDKATPTAVLGVRDAVAVAAGVGHACALDARGLVSCWGANDAGQLCDGTTVERPKAVPMSGVTGASAIAAGLAHTCAIVGGRVRCCGSNSVGQLGDGTTTAQPGGAWVPGVRDAHAITAGQAHTCAVLAGGKVMCWGWNENGQLGDGTTENRLSPIAVSGVTDAVEVASSGLASSTCAVLRDRSVRCWGWNTTGLLGDGTTERRLVPTPVVDLRDVRSISVGARHACALVQGGEVRCWGSNQDNEITGRFLPTVLRPLPIALPQPAVAVVAGPLGGNVALFAGTQAAAWGGFFSRLQRQVDPPVQTDIFTFYPPPGFRRQDRDDSLAYQDTIAPRILEMFMLREPLPKDEKGEVVFRRAVPKLGRITATVPAGTQEHGAHKLHWFTQRSSVNHTPIVSIGFLVAKASAYAVVRLVAADGKLGEARPLLEKLVDKGWFKLP